MTSRIEQIIEEVENYLNSCKFQPLSSTKIIVNKEELEELLREIRLKTPEEIKRYQKIISNKDAILADATNKANNIVEEATIKADEIVSEHEITRQAYNQANYIIEEANQKAKEIVDKAIEESDNLKVNALKYSDQLLGNVENIVSRALDIYGSKYDELMGGLTDSYETIRSNRKELNIVNQADE